MHPLTSLSAAKMAVWTLGAAALVAACGSDDQAPTSSTPTGPGSGFINTGGSGGGTGTGGSNGTGGVAILPGVSFTQGEYGAFGLGQEITGSGLANTGVTTDQQACNTIAGVVRDFKGADEGGHGDFETFSGSGATVGMVGAALGADGKPTYTGVCQAAGKTTACPSGQQSTTQQAFDQWYRYTQDVNKAFVIYLQFTPNNGLMTFQSHDYFPVDGKGWGNYKTTAHNYHFTTEIHTKFKYGGGETFSFLGDDDVWVFINGKLAVDLGGLHTEVQGSVNLDQDAAKLGIEKGKEYTLDLFHAERHTSQSNFRIDTNFAFTDCGTTIPPDIR